MQKFRCRALFYARSSIIKHLLMTKFAIILLFAFSTQSFAKSYGQKNNISLRLEKASIKRVFKAIEDQGYFRFVYKDDILPREQQVSIRVQDAPLDEVLAKVLANTSLHYRLLSDNLIVITRDNSSSPQAPAGTPFSGKVTNNKGEPLSGVSVIEKGTNNGTTTKDDGTFTLQVTNPNDTLVFTYVGFLQQEVPIGGSNNLKIILSSETSNLNDAIVIGYQTVRRKDLTGATGIVNMDQASKVTSGTVAESIQGLVPGVTVRNAGNPGANPTVEIRGVTSFSSSDPLYVIDGMLSDANATVNPDDVASIQVLKDASAAAIYGARAGNGVIIITTRKGKSGPAKIGLSAKYGWQSMPKKWDVMDAPQWLKTVSTEYNNTGIALPTGYAAQVANNTVNTNWQDAVTRQGYDQDYNLSISGGSPTSSYLISGSYYKNQGILIGNDFQRSSVRINTDTRKGRLTIGENLMLSNSSGEAPGGGINAFYEAADMLPVIAVKGSQYASLPSNPGNWGFGSVDYPTYSSNYAAVAALDQITYNYAKIIGNAYAEFKLTDWLSYRFNAGVEASFDYSKEVRDTGIWRYGNQPPATSISNSRSTFTNFLLEHTLNFNKSFGEHAVSAVAGFSRTQQEREFTNAGRTYLTTVDGYTYSTINSATGSPNAAGGTSTLWRQHGYLARINYTYSDKYLLTLTGRIDQDTRFGPDNRTGYFPSAAVGWRISKEKFFNVAWVNDLKLRGSYGKLGISSGLDNYSNFPYAPVINTAPRAIYGAGQTPLVGAYTANLANSDIHWETRTEKNIGFDANLFNNRVSITADVYSSLGTGVLVALQLPEYLGVVQPSNGTSTVINAASIRNKGIELAVTYRSAPNQDFKWDVSANLTTINNKVVSVGNQGIDANGNKVDYIQATDFIRAQVGHSIGQWYMIKTAGIFKSQDEINHYTNKSGVIIQPDAKPGDVKYVDKDGDGTISDKDRQYTGSPWPTLQGGAQFNASYKNFTLNIQLVGVFGLKIYDDIRHVLDGYQLTNFRKDIDPWSPSNPNGKDPRLAVSPNDPQVAINNMSQTNRWLENGSYLRVRNIELGYYLPKTTLAKAGINSARVYISGQNLLTFTDYKGLDPDVVGNGILQRGFDGGNWPPSRVLSAGLQFDF